MSRHNRSVKLRLFLVVSMVIGLVSLAFAPGASSWTCEPDDYLESECGPTTVANTTTTSVVVNTVVAPTTTTTEAPPSTTTTTASTVAPTTTTATTTTVETSAPSTTTTTTSPPSTTTLSPTSTTTSPSTSTTSTLPSTFAFGDAETVCQREVPTILITFDAPGFPSLAGRAGTLTMRDVNGIVVQVVPLTYEPGVTTAVLYPGTSVNPDGSIADVPGWELNSDGFWVPDDSDAFLREGIFLTYEVNPTAGPVLVTYPPESSDCANPDGPFPPAPLVPVPGQLPPTA